MQAIQFLSLVFLATIVRSGAIEVHERGIRNRGINAGTTALERSSDSSSENGGYEGYNSNDGKGGNSNDGKGGNSNDGKGGNSNKGSKYSVSTYCEIESTYESTLKQVNIGVKIIFDAIRQILKSPGDKSIVVDEQKERAYNAFRNAIVWTIKVAAKIRSDKSSQSQSNIDAALGHLNTVLRCLFDAMKMSTSKNNRNLPDEIQRSEDGATESAVAVIEQIYASISRAAKGDARLQSSTEKYLKKSTKFIQRCLSFFFLGIRKLSSTVNPEVRYKDCDSCSTSTIDDAQIRSTNAMEIQLIAQFDALRSICRRRCSDGSGCETQQCSDVNSRVDIY